MPEYKITPGAERKFSGSASGIRPGEKLTEDLWGEGESSTTTSHPKILHVASAPIDPAWLEDEIAELERLVDAGETVQVVAQLADMIRSSHRLDEPAAAAEAKASTAATLPPAAS